MTDFAPTPWRRSEHLGLNSIEDASGKLVASVPWNSGQPEVGDKILATIITAVNSHAQLVAACEAVFDAIDKHEFDGDVLWIQPPYQAAGVHETAWERLLSVLQEVREEAGDVG